MQTLPALLTETNLELLPQSITVQHGIEYGLARLHGRLMLAAISAAGETPLPRFEGEFSILSGKSLATAPLTRSNAALLRQQLPWLQPTLLGLRTSAGMGDRLGLATPGHVRAVRATGCQVAPIFAQQSMREMARTGRSPQQVMDDATWGIFQENWQEGFGADADHLKTAEDIDICLAAGFTFFTIDPGQYVDNRAEAASFSELLELSERLPEDMRARQTGLLNRALEIEHLRVEFDEMVLRRAMVKYGQAVWHVVQLSRHLTEAAGSRPYELEISVDETEQPTTHAEHAYIASELKRLGVRWVSLAPRFIGRFEKGVDYIGEPSAFETDAAGHAAIARHFGPYKLSLHSGSDKFSIYPAAMRKTRGLVHLKTAGTSYLEALRTVAALDAGLFEEIYAFAREHYERDRASYHVSGQLSKAPLLTPGSDGSNLLENFDAREIMHVTFGSVLQERTPDGSYRFYNRLMDLLQSQPEEYARNLEQHFTRHLMPFSAASSSSISAIM